MNAENIPAQWWLVLLKCGVGMHHRSHIRTYKWDDIQLNILYVRISNKCFNCKMVHSVYSDFYTDLSEV